MKKICKKRIFIIFSIIMVSFVTLNLFYSDVQAQLNPDLENSDQDFASGLNTIASFLAKVSFSSTFSGLAGLITALAGVLYLLFGLIFSGSTGSIMPTPDNIIFNRVAILDVNFFNPNAHSIIGMSADIIPKLYNSFHMIAFSIFTIAAMLVGIKMALSTVAADKAAAKKAMVNWIVGIMVLFLMRLIVAAIFELNEFIVWKIACATQSANFGISAAFEVTDIFEFIGNPIGGLIDAIAKFGTSLSGSSTINFR